MDYNKIYNNIIEKAKKRQQLQPLTYYKEIHHIIPKSIGGDNKPSNLVALTLKEHFICHKLLIYIYKNNKSLIYAYWMMCNTRNRNNTNNTINKYYNISAREYEQAKILYIKSKTGFKLNNKQKSYISNKTQEAMSDANIRKKCSANKGAKWYYNKKH